MKQVITIPNLLFKKFLSHINEIVEFAKRIVCYYTNWAQYRPGEGKFLPEQIDPFLCSHIIYAFAKLDNFKLESFEWNDKDTEWSKGMYQRVINLKVKNPSLRVMIAVGGLFLNFNQN